VADDLAVWLFGNRVAVIDRERDRLRLAYTDEALDRYPLGTPLLSLSLPVANRRYPQGIGRPFLDGLLPEGDARRAIARDVGESPNDTYGLIRALRRDRAGAIVIRPVGDPAPPRPTTVTAEPLDGTPSTHILEPEIAAIPQTVENEAFCMRVARHLGLAVRRDRDDRDRRAQGDRGRAV
jgi:serine/threonine-protein kinase HipA